MNIADYDAALLRGKNPAWLIMRVIQYRICWFAGEKEGWSDSMTYAKIFEQREEAFAVARQVRGLMVIYL